MASSNRIGASSYRRQYCRRLRWLRLFALCALCSCRYAFAEEQTSTLANFDGVSQLNDRWTATGSVRLHRENAPSPKPIQGVAGQWLTCEVEGPARIKTRNRRRPAFEKFDTIQLRIKAENASAQNPKSFEFQFHSHERRAVLWRKFSVTKPGWQLVALPMQHFRYSPGASLEWEEVSQFGIAFRNPGRFSFDGIELVASRSKSNPFFTPEEIGEIAFGDEAKVSASTHFALITNDRRVNTNATLSECEKLFALVYKDFPELPLPSRTVPVLVFETEREYREFWPELASLYVANVPPIRSSGYSLLGIAGTSYTDEFGSVRPVLIHETCHALLARTLGLSNSSEWLHEGLANYYQLRWTKQDLRKLNRVRFRNGTHRPLRQLLNGRRIAMNDYAQAALFVKWLIEDKTKREQFAKSLQNMRKRNSTSLEPICRRHFGKSIEKLELDWLRWARAGN